MASSLPQNQDQQNQLTNKYLENNNKKAYELLMRIQSQLEAASVIAVSTKKVADYE